MRFPKPSRRTPSPRKRLTRTVPPRKRSARRASVVALDAAWSKAVRERAGHACERCGATVGMWLPTGRVDALDAHHRLSKKAWPSLRHLVSNGVLLCRPCHEFAHRHPTEFKVWIAER